MLTGSELPRQFSEGLLGLARIGEGLGCVLRRADDPRALTRPVVHFNGGLSIEHQVVRDCLIGDAYVAALHWLSVLEPTVKREGLALQLRMPAEDFNFTFD